MADPDHIAQLKKRVDAPQRGGPPPGGPPPGGPHKGEAQRGGPQQGEPPRGEPQRGGPREGELRSLGFVPMVFNFDKPETKDFTETVRLLANLSRLVIVDITNPRSAPLELQATVPDYLVPFAPILQDGEESFAMFVDLRRKYNWVLDVIRYPSVDRLIEVLEDKIVRRAEAKFNELLTRRTEQLRVEDI